MTTQTNTTPSDSEVGVQPAHVGCWTKISHQNATKYQRTAVQAVRSLLNNLDSWPSHWADLKWALNHLEEEVNNGYLTNLEGLLYDTRLLVEADRLYSELHDFQARIARLGGVLTLVAHLLDEQATRMPTPECEGGDCELG